MARESDSDLLNPRRRRGLGRGLDALLGRSDERPREVEGEGGPAAGAGGVLELAVEAIQANPHQPRSRFEPGSLTDLAASIREHGVIQPLIVTESPDQPARYWLVTGERRWRAARQAGAATVPVVVREATPQQRLELALVENLQRADLSALEEASAFESLIEEFGLTQAEVARRVGKSRSAVANAVRLLASPAPVRAALNDRLISAGHARALLGLASDDQVRQALDMVVARELSVRQTEAMVHRWLEEPEEEAESEETLQLKAQLRSLENRIRDRLGTKVRLDRKADGSGRLVIHFFSDDELETIFREIAGQEEGL